MSQPPILDPVHPEEIELTSRLLTGKFTGRLLFVVIDINEPRKADVLKVLEAQEAGRAIPPYHRVTKAYFYDNDFKDYKALVDVTSREVVLLERMPLTSKLPLSYKSAMDLEKICFEHPKVIAELEKIGLPPDCEVRADTWIYGTDDANEFRRLVQFYFYVAKSNHPQSNHYSWPLKFSPVFDIATQELVRSDYIPSGLDMNITSDFIKDKEVVEYHPDLTGLSPREGLKPLHVVQPEGASFQCDGNTVHWQKWSFTIGFNYREGVILYNLKFDGRNVFYRLSLSEMTVPYGDPRPPLHRKQAFDLGDVGFGRCANELKLGCDCLGHIKYFDFYLNDDKGKPSLKAGAVCLHEQDAGLLFKHVNYRNDEATVARRRELVVQSIATVANYEYVLEFILNQAGEIDLQARATGILSTTPIDEGITVPFGTVVAPGVLAPYHQHLLSFRIDPAIDGHNNSLQVRDTVPMPIDDVFNPLGIGYVTEPKIIEKPTPLEQNVATYREFRLINEQVINKVTMTPVGYKVTLPPSQSIIAGPKAFNQKRAFFATSPFFLTRYGDDQLYAAGEFTNQSIQDHGLKEWVSSEESVRNEDIVLWATMGFTHNPRPEDFPVMPVEIHTIHLKPSGFFEKNPALDLPLSNQAVNKSTLVPGQPSEPCCSHSNI